jgi:uncharacterized protein (UPF0248 family)
MAILDHRGNPIPSHHQRSLAAIKLALFQKLKASYDAAKTSSFNEGHWSNADYKSPHDEHNPQTRRKILERARYEYRNGSYTKGMIKTLGNDFIGSGVKLQITDDDLPLIRQNNIEKWYLRWAKEIKLRQKLKRMKIAKARDGETFAIFYTDRKLNSPIKLNLKIIECEQVSDPFDGKAHDNVIDGIRFDENMTPEAYYILYEHPGSSFLHRRKKGDGEWVKAQYVIHWYDQDRPYHRGVSEITPMLPLCSIRRRYTLAVLTAAETAADYAVLLESEAPANAMAWLQDADGMVADESLFDSFPIDKGLITQLPYGVKAHQMKAEQPTSQHPEFISSIIQEEARCLNMPFNIAIGNSGGYNFASGTLDKQLYYGSLYREREACEDEVMTPKVLTNFLQEAYLMPDIFGSELALIIPERLPDHVWRWDVYPQHADPMKEANARKTRWHLGEISDKDIQETTYNRSVEEHYKNIEEQQVARKRLGLPLPEVQDSDDEKEQESEPSNDN